MKASAKTTKMTSAKAPKVSLGGSTQTPSGLMNVSGASKKDYSKKKPAGADFGNISFGQTGLREIS